MFRHMAWVCVALCLGFAGAAYAQYDVPKWVEQDQQAGSRGELVQDVYSGAGKGRIDWEYGYLEVSAYGAATREEVLNEADERIQAEANARYNALEILAEIVGGVKVTADVTLANMRTQNATVRQQVDAILQGVQQRGDTEHQRMSDGSVLARVAMGTHLYGQDGMIPKVLNIQPIRQQVEQAVQTPTRIGHRISARVTAPSQPAPGSATGLVLDCRNMRPKPAITASVSIVSRSGEVIYDFRQVPREVWMNAAVVGYTTSLDRPFIRQKVGNDPLVIEPIGLADDREDRLVLSDEDAQRVHTADGSFLNQARVVLLY